MTSYAFGFKMKIQYLAFKCTFSFMEKEFCFKLCINKQSFVNQHSPDWRDDGPISGASLSGELF